MPQPPDSRHGAGAEPGRDSGLPRDTRAVVLSLVTSFAGRLYGQRSAKTGRLRAVVAAETWAGDAHDGGEAA